MTEAKKAKRKLIKTGTYTYMVTLPKEWVQKLGCLAQIEDLFKISPMQNYILRRSVPS